MNPFYFNDTAAYLIDPSFTKEEVEAEGYLRRDEEIKVDIPEWMEVVEVKDLGMYEGWKQISSSSPLPSPLLQGEGAKRHIDPTILKKVIRDEQ